MSNKEYVDLDQLVYDNLTLLFLRKKLDDFTLDTFRMVVECNKQKKGLIKTRIERYQEMRKRYDSALLTLEMQGFIERKQEGTSTPYFVTGRGRQLISLIMEEKQSQMGGNTL